MNNPVKNKKELVERILSNKERIRSFGVLRLGIFGSFVRDEVKESSDVDFFADIKFEYKTLKNFSALYDFLEQLTGRKIEIITPQSLSKYIGPYILKEVEYVSIAAWIYPAYNWWMWIYSAIFKWQNRRRDKDATLSRALIRSLEIIGEATKRVNDDLKRKHPQIEWKEIAKMRDKLIHHYFGIEYDIVYNTINNDIPELLHELKRILELEKE